MFSSADSGGAGVNVKTGTGTGQKTKIKEERKEVRGWSRRCRDTTVFLYPVRRNNAAILWLRVFKWHFLVQQLQFYRHW